jgi:hypothetical protein
MDQSTRLSHPSDISLLLRAYAEQRWLASELLPVVRELESPDQVPEEQVGAALAYLEILWVDARRRAAETEAAREALVTAGPARCSSTVVSERARRYNAAVRRLRASTDARVRRITHVGSPPSPRECAGL